MNTAIVMMGSNENPKENITLAKEKINERYEITSISSCPVTKPRGSKYKNMFHNQAITVLSDEDLANTILFFKHLERELGRVPGDKKEGLVKIDIDVIFWNGRQMRGDYDSYDFVKTCVDEILPKE